MEQIPNFFPLIGVVVGLLACCLLIYLGSMASNPWLKWGLLVAALGMGIVSFSKLSSAIGSAWASAPTVPKSNTPLQAPRP
jgi:hypothetical protein